ncbi:glycosyltransferase family 4 protein [Eisenbergiella sp.]
MNMKVLIIRTFPDILNLNMYNVQEIGLAKALVCKGLECGVVLYHGNEENKEEIYQFEKEKKSYSFKIYWLKGISFYKNGFMPSVYKIINDYDVLQVHEYDQIFSWMLYSKLRKPTVIYHGPYYHPYAKGYNLKCKVFDTCFLKLRNYSHVVALTKSELAADFLRKKGFNKVHAVGVGVDSDKFLPALKEEISCRIEEDTSKIRLLYVGKIEERRNVYFLIELFEKLQEKIDNLQLVIVGSGEADYLDAFLKRIQPWLDTGKIVYFRDATQRELSLIYQRVNLFIFTSNYEIFGMVLLEAMYFGLPVISSMNGGASVLIENGENGYIMQSFDCTDWENIILNIIRNKELAAGIGKKAQITISEFFLWDKLADKFINAYYEAIAEYKKYKE